jgi:hypothetical protein
MNTRNRGDKCCKIETRTRQVRTVKAVGREEKLLGGGRRKGREQGTVLSISEGEKETGGEMRNRSQVNQRMLCSND